MRPFLIIFSLLLSILCYGAEAWGGEDVPSGSVDQHWASLFSEQQSESTPSNKQLRTPLFQTSYTTTFKEAPSTSPRLRDLSPETARAQTKGLLAKTDWLKRTVSSEIEIAHSQGGESWLQSTIPGDNRTTASTRMVRLGLTGTEGSFRYGLTYRTAGQGFLDAPNQTRREVWNEWKTGLAKVWSAIGQQWNNVMGDSTRPMLEQMYGRMGVTLIKPAWPGLSLTYTRSSLSSAFEPLGIPPQHSQSHTLDGALAYESSRWNVRLASIYALTDNLVRGGAHSQVRMQTLNASFNPLNGVTIAPKLAYREDIQYGSGVRTENPSASLALQYRRNHRLVVSGSANYACSRSSDGLVDKEALGGKGILRWGIQQSADWDTVISIEAGYNRLTDRSLPSAGTEDISGLLRFVVAAL